jgi:hypothetical protein
VSGHTKGPWEIVPYSYEEERLQIVSEYQELGGGKRRANWIAECDLQDDQEENKANARLIAAAPELLTELKWALERLEQWSSNASGGDDAKMERSMKFYERIRTAIAKAEGK